MDTSKTDPSFWYVAQCLPISGCSCLQFYPFLVLRFGKGDVEQESLSVIAISNNMW